MGQGSWPLHPLGRPAVLNGLSSLSFKVGFRLATTGALIVRADGVTIVRAGPFLTLTVTLRALVRMRAMTMRGLLSAGEIRLPNTTAGAARGSC